MRYFLIAALFVIACAFVFRTVRGGETPKVEAVLALSKAPSRGINPRLELTLTNRGDQPVSLVLPGDGSECGARTPRLNYIWLRDGNIVVPPVPGFTCGNVNPLRAGEVFTLQPGASRTITEWLGPRWPVAGVYQLKLRYTNKPDARFGDPSDPHDAAEMQKLRASTPVTVESNTIDITIAEPIQTKSR